MIINLSKIKTEALLLICKDLIIGYKDSQNNIFGIDQNIIDYINNKIELIVLNINKVVKDENFYIQNNSNYQIRYVLKNYNLLNKLLSKKLSNGESFNPAMLCIALLSTWFAELEKESKSKEYLYFSLFSYNEFYDKVLIEPKNTNFKALNIKMVNIAEDVIKSYDEFSLF
jgi:hypothetical protein